MNCAKCRLCIFVLGLAVLVILTGCASGGGRGSRGKLSDATAEAAGKDKKSESDQNSTQTFSEINESDSHEKESSQPGPTSTTKSKSDYDPDYSSNEKDIETPEKEIVGFKMGPSVWYSQSRIAGDMIRGFSSFTIMYGGYLKKRIRLDIGLYYGNGKRGNQQNIQEGINSINEVGGEANGRFYITSDHTLMGIYLLGGIRWGLMSWSYTNGIEIPNEDGGIDTISSDMVEMWTYFAGLGISLLQTKVVHLGACATAGFRASKDTTFEDFDNNVFKDVGETRLSLVACIIF